MYLISDKGNRIISTKEAIEIMKDTRKGFIIYGLEKGGVLHEVSMTFNSADELNKEATRQKILGYKVYSHVDEEPQEDAKEQPTNDNGSKKPAVKKSSPKRKRS